MAKIVRVTPAQANVANLRIKRSVASGKFVPPTVSAVASARQATSRTQPAAGS